MPANLFALIVLLSIGCASTSVQQPEPIAEPLEPPQCPAGEFRGIGADEASALSDLARQINSSVSVIIKRTIDKRDNGGKEDLTIVYEDTMLMKSFLPNAHDAYVLYNKRGNVAVCMSKANAARGFLERQRLVADSLEMVSGDMLGTEHPRHKNEAWRRTQALYGDFIRIQYLLEGWEVGSPYQAGDIYSRAREGYKGYCQNIKVFWEDAGNECSDVVFAALSKKIKMEKSECSGGLRLRFNCLEKCKYSSFGVECSYEPSLAIESCGLEKYSLLKAKMPETGSDMHSESKAREKLAENLPKAAFFNEWEKEVREWVPQCAD